MSHKNLQLISLATVSLSLLTFIVVTINQRTRMQGLIGLLGSALLLFGTIRGYFFHDISSQTYLLIFGSSLLFGSTLMIFQRSRA